MLSNTYLFFLIACGDSTEKDTATVEDDTAQEEVEIEEVRTLPDSGCEQEGWLMYSGGEYYYFMNTYDEEERLVYYEFNDMTLSLDNSIDEAYWYTYNSENLLETQQDDLDGDGDVEQQSEWVYESNGYPIEYRMDNDFDDIYDDEWLTIRDDQGYVLEQTFDEAMDGTIDTRWTTDWNADMTQVILSEDEGDDGTVEAIIEAELEGIYTISRSRDEGADGTLDYVETWAYNDDGNLTRYELDDDGDGAWDFIRVIEWLNADQFDTVEDTYYDATGTVEGSYLSSMSYDDDGFTDEMQVTGSSEYSIDHRWYCAE